MPKWNTVGILVAGTFMVFAQSALAAGDVENGKKVYKKCAACHSLMIVKQQGLSRADWDESLEWMVEEQGMTPIEDEATRERVLDYLTNHFGRE